MKKLTSLDEIKKISGGNNDLIKEFISKFIIQLSEQLIGLNSNLSQGNAKEIKNTAHKMKSTLFYFGMHHQRDLTEEIEKSITNDFEKMKPIVKELIGSCELAIVELNSDLALL